MKKVKGVALASALLLVVAACGGDDDEPVAGGSSTTSAETTIAGETTTSAPAEDTGCTAERQGGELTFGVGSLMARGLDPTVALGTGVAGATEIGALFDTLMRYNPDTGEFETHLAESLTPNDDSTEWTLTLPEGVTFGNGDPLDAAAVAFSLERLAASTVAMSGMAQEVERTEVVDERTIVYTLKQSWGGFPYFLATEGGMVVNPAVVEAKGEQFANDPTGGGVGPYEVERFEPNVEIVLTAKDDYWGGPVCIETLRFVQVPGGRATYEAFQAGELDVMFVLEPDVLADIEADEVAGRGAVNGGGLTLLLNSGRGADPVLADVRLRRAITLALDPEVINDRVYGGNGKVSTGLIDTDQRIYPGFGGPETDPDAARALVEEAKADGFDGTVRVTCGDTPSGVEQTITVKALLDAVGFDTVTENLPSAQANQKILFDGNYDIGCGSVSVFEEGPVRGINQFYSTSPRNRVGYANAEMDAGIDALYQASTEEEATEAMRTLQEVWNETATSVNLLASVWFVGHTDEVHDLVMTREAAVLFHDAWMG